uniref:Uncharacterized protein n=1 Tax=viral metagenome TaxID=1070528 RepID=A0A6C0EKT2_9ZZZZ
MIKPYKITYISFDSNYTTESKQILLKDINTVKNTLSHQYNYNQLIEQLKIKYNELYKTDRGFNRHHYIFCGPINVGIEPILNSLESTLQYPSTEQLLILDNFFSYSCKKEWGDLAQYTSVKFITTYIRKDDTLSSIKTTICTKLKDFLPLGDIFFYEQLYLTCKLDRDSYMYLNDTLKSMGGDILPEDIVIQSIIKKILEKRIKLNYQNIKFELIGLGYSEEESKLFLETYLNDVSSLDLNSIKTNIQLKLYINEIITNPLLTHYYYTYNKTNIYINNFLAYFLDRNYTEGYNLQLNTVKNTVDESNMNKILSSFGNIDNNELYVYNFRNIHNYVLQKNVFNLTQSDDTSLYFNGFITKFFPKITSLNYKTLLDKKLTNNDHLETLEMYNKVIDTKTNLFSIIDDRYQFFDLDIRISHTTYNQTIISHNLNLPLDLDLLRIFNELELSFTIPFVKLKDPNTKNTVYKLYTKITKRIDNKLPEIHKNMLSEWIDINSYECINGIFIPIKGSPKHINYKFKLINILVKDGINTGSIVKLNYNEDLLISLDIDVEGIINTINVEFIKTKTNYKINDVIEFYSFDTLYADIEITKKGLVELKINFRDPNYVTDETIFKKILDAFNNFIKDLKNIDYFKSYTHIILPVNTNLLTLNPKFYNSRFSYNNVSLDLELDNTIGLNFDRIKKLVINFFPYLSFKTELFYKDQTIEFLNETEEGNDWIDAKITDILKDDKYNILVTNLTKGQKTAHKNIDVKFIREKGDVTYRKDINLVYKRISDFNEQLPIKQLIYKLFNQGQSKNIIYNRVIKEYEISVESAKNLIATTIGENSSKLSYNMFQMGINIKINYLEPIKKGNKHIYKIHIDEFKTLDELNTVKHFIVNFFNTYSILINPSLNPDFSKRYSEYLSTSNIDASIIDTSNKIEQDLEIKKTAEQHNDQFNEHNTSWLDEDTDSDDSDDELFNAKEDEASTNPVIDKKDGIKDRIKDEIKGVTDFEMIQHETKNPLLKRLYDNDNTLFDWVSPTTGKRYSKICQSERYPILISDEEKKHIDENFPKSYNDDKNDIECSIKTNKKDINSKTACSAIEWGSSDNNLNWYICPKIWDLQDNVSLNVSDLEFKGLGWNMGEEKGKAMYGEHWMKKDFVSDPESLNNQLRKKNKLPEISWREDKTKPIINPKTTKLFPDILDFGPMYKKRGVVSDMKKVSSRASLHIEDISNQKTYNYPGFLKSGPPSGSKPVPCCFQGNSKNISSAFGINEAETDESNGYIQGSDKSLGWNPPRIGLLPKELFGYFGMTEDSCKTGSLNIKNRCFLRKGIKQSSNVFFALIASLYPNSTIDETDIIDLVLENITEQEFKTLNKGNLEIIFRDNIKQISSFQNYLEYLVSDEQKDYRHLYDYLTRPHPWLFKKGLILIILEFKDGKYFQHCPYFMETNWYNGNSPISIVIKNDEELEPIVLYNKSYRAERTFTATEPNIEFFFKYITECLLQSNIKTTLIKNPQSKRISYKESISLLDLIARLRKLDKGLKYETNKYLVDNSNKIIGLLTKNDVIIPCSPHILEANFIETTHYININKVGNLIYANEMLDHYIKLSKLLEYEIKPLRKIVEEDQVISLELDTGHIIPTKKTEIRIGIDHTTVYNSLDTKQNLAYIDKRLESYANFYSEDFFAKKKSLYESVHIINNIQSIYLDDSKKIEKIYIKNNIVQGIILMNGILVETLPINYSDIKDILKLDLSTVVKFTSEYYIDDYEKSIQDYYELWKYSNYALEVKPIRNIINNNKQVVGILLQQGSIIKLNPGHIFQIFKRKGSSYLINTLVDNEFSILIDDIKPKLYESKYIDDRIKHINQIDYKKTLYGNIKKSLSSFLQLSENYVIKQFIKEQLNFLGKTITRKRNDIYFIINKLFNLVGADRLIDESEFNKLLTTNTFPNCSLANDSKTCNGLCSPQDKAVLIKETEESFFKRIWLKYYPNYKETLASRENINAYLLENTDYAISDSEETNINNFFDYIYKDAVEKESDDEIIKEKMKQVRNNMKIMNSIVDNTVKLDYFKCRYNIFTIYKSTKPTVYKSLYNSFLNTFLEEIIRNKFKRSQILDNIKLIDEDVKYMHTVDEIILYDTDVEASKISEFYHTIKKKYYKNITSYDDSKPLEIKEFINTNVPLIKNIKHKLVKSNSNLTYRIIKLDGSRKLNKNATEVIPTKDLSKQEFLKIEEHLDLINCERSKYMIESENNKYTYIRLSHKKLNKFTG